VAGAFLAPGAAEAITGTTTTETWLNSPTLPVRFNSPKGKCTLFEAKIIGQPVDVADTFTGKIRCTEVQVDHVPACKVRGSGDPVGSMQVTTNYLTGELVWLNNVGTTAGLKLEIDTGQKNLAELILEGGECALAGPYPLTEKIIAQVTPVGIEALKGTLTFPPIPPVTDCDAPIKTYWKGTIKELKEIGHEFSLAGSLLRLKAKEATLCTEFEIDLTSGKKWGVFDG
jgi:hypothetical protein